MPDTEDRELEQIMEEVFTEESGIDKQKVINEVDKHGLLNPDGWDDKEAGFFDVKDFFKKCADKILSKYIRKTEFLKKWDDNAKVIHHIMSLAEANVKAELGHLEEFEKIANQLGYIRKDAIVLDEEKIGKVFCDECYKGYQVCCPYESDMDNCPDRLRFTKALSEASGEIIKEKK